MRGRRPKGLRLLVSCWARSYACFACAPKVIVLAAQTNPMPPILIRSLLLALLIAPARAQPQTWAWDDGTVPYVNTPVEIVERMMRMAEVRAGDFVIDLGSGDGGIGDWPADETLEMRTPEKPVGVGGISKVELWIVPAEMRGTWSSQLPQHGGAWRFQIAQRYQMLDVAVLAEGRDLLVRNTRLRGEEVKLVITGVVKNRAWHHYFVGTARGDAIEGEVTVSDGNNKVVYPWLAKRAR